MRNYGLLEEIRELGAYITGQSPMPWIPYNESGNWEKYLPKFEHQAEDFETNGCTCYSTLNQIETLYKFLLRVEPNYSERFTYLRVPINPASGADPQKVYETIRNDGLVDERYFPLEKEKNDFLDTSDITGSLLARGQRWLSKHDFKHEWLWDGRPDNWLEVLKDGLTTSPIAVSVTAWTRRGDEYIDNGKRNNHWCLAYKVDKDGHVWVFDTYDHSKKKLAKNHYIHRAKRIWISRNTLRDLRREKSRLEKILNFLLMKQTLLTVVREYLGKDASPLDRAPDELACVESVTELVKKVYPDEPIMTGTWTYWEHLKNSPHWEESTEFAPEVIVISPTGTGKGVGHVGICTDRNTIASNTSFGINKGRFLENYTPETWRQRYAEKQGMPVYLFKRK